MHTVTIEAPDIHCDGCAAAIRRSLGKLAGVVRTDVDVLARTVTVLYDETITTDVAVSDHLTAAGFPPRVG